VRGRAASRVGEYPTPERGEGVGKDTAIEQTFLALGETIAGEKKKRSCFISET
jgi:hypothetical protein